MPPASGPRTPPAWAALLVGLAGVMIGLALPWAPVWATTTTVTWPTPGSDVASASAVVVPYRPTALVASVPCSALRAGATAAQPVVVLATGTGTDGLIVTSGSDGATVLLDGLAVDLPTTGDCRTVITAGPDGVSVGAADGQLVDLPDQPVPKVFGFRTDLSPADAAGLTVTADLTDPFGTSPGALKIVLIVAQLLLVAAALAMLRRASRRRLRWRGRRRWRVRWRNAWLIDAGVVILLAGWAVIGPLAVDDGWATMIARTYADSGSPGNYYRWWNAAEVPFALSHQLLAPLTEITIEPLWLRLPSTVCAIATWFVLSRGVLGSALPGRAGTARVRLLAALCLLVAWLPFNLGTRPESYVALGVTVVLALAMRSRDLAGLGWLVLAAALAVPISPNSVLVVAPILIFAPRLLAALRASSPTRRHLLAHVLLLCCVGAVSLTVIFGDQSADALLTATDWHTYFGPSLPWYDEAVRYQYLLQSDQQGSMAKRLPVLMSVAMLPIVGLLMLRRGSRDAVGRSAVRLAAVVLVALALFAISPSKWSYHFGAAAGLFAALLTVAVVLVVRRARAPDRYRVMVGIGGSALMIAALALTFDGPNAWWIPAVYDGPWPTEPPRPFGVPTNNPLVWLGVLLVVLAGALVVGDRRTRATRALVAGPAVLVGTAGVATLGLLLGSFVAAPVRQPAGSLALDNLNGFTDEDACGLADDVELLPDGPQLSVAPEPGGQLAGFVPLGGFPPDAPPPEPPGSGASEYLWGSHGSGSADTATMTSPWFVLPEQDPDGGVALSVSGRTDEDNQLTFEFGRSDASGVTLLGEQALQDRPASDEDPDNPLWRSIGIDASAIPFRADRIRIDAVADVGARTDGFDWLAFTGPRLRSVVGLNQFLADNGPVLISWPQAFLFPCVRDVATVSGGLAQTPRTLIESPRPWHTDARERYIGGTFHELTVFGELREIPSRLSGAPDVDWGSLFSSADTADPDAYLRTERRELVAGIGGTPHVPPER